MYVNLMLLTKVYVKVEPHKQSLRKQSMLRSIKLKVGDDWCVCACFRSWPVISRVLRAVKEVVVTDDSAKPCISFFSLSTLSFCALLPLSSHSPLCILFIPLFYSGSKFSVLLSLFQSITPNQVFFSLFL